MNESFGTTKYSKWIRGSLTAQSRKRLNLSERHSLTELREICATKESGGGQIGSHLVISIHRNQSRKVPIMALKWVITKGQNNERRDYCIRTSTLFVNEMEVRWTDEVVQFINTIRVRGILLLPTKISSYFSISSFIHFSLLSFSSPHLFKKIIQ